MELSIVALLMVLGVILLVVEIALIPGVGITGVLGVLSLIVAICYSFFTLGALIGWLCVAVVLVACVALFLWAVYGKTLDKVALKENIYSTVENADANELKIGDKGVALTRLALIGEVDFDGRIVEVKSGNGFIDEGTNVVIDRINNSNIIVRRA